MNSTVAVIGVGKMGGGIARTLARSGKFEVRVFDLSSAACQACAAEGASVADTALEAAKGADIVITSLPMPVHVEGMWDELSTELAAGTLCVDVSTIDPTTARRIADQLSAEGLRFVACTLGKGPAQAETGDSPLFVGGADQDIDALSELFETIGDQVHRMGSVEAATTFKLVSNLIGMTNLAVLAEGYLLCHRAGVDDEAFAQALKDTGAWSYQADIRLPWMMAGDFESRFPVPLGLKDVRLAVDMAGQWNLGVPVAAAAMSQLAATVAHGYADDDVNAVLKVLDPRGEVFGERNE